MDNLERPVDTLSAKTVTPPSLSTQQLSDHMDQTRAIPIHISRKSSQEGSPLTKHRLEGLQGYDLDNSQFSQSL